MTVTQAELDGHIFDRNGQLCALLPVYNTRTREVDTQITPIKDRAEGLRLVAQALAKEATRKNAIANRHLTFRELLDHFKQHKSLKPWYEAVFLEFFGDYRLSHINYELLAAFAAYRSTVGHKGTGLARTIATLNRELEALRRVLLFAARRGWIEQNPFTAGPPLIKTSEEQPRERLLADEEEARLLAGCTGPRAHLRPIIIGAVDTGLRREVLLSLRVGQIDLQRRVIDLGRPKRGKKRHPQLCGLSERFEREIKQLLSENPWLGPDDPLFGLKDVRRAFNTLCREASVENLHFHDLRHRFATDAIRAGIPKDLAMKATGHTSPEIFSEVYLTVDGNLMKGITDQIDQHRRRRQQSQNTPQPSSKGPDATPAWI